MAVRCLPSPFFPCFPPPGSDFVFRMRRWWYLCLSWGQRFLFPQSCTGISGRKTKSWRMPSSGSGTISPGIGMSASKATRRGNCYRLFHEVNSLAAILNAHAESEARSKTFLKHTISDISHQLKTPLAALNIYNGLMQQEADASPAIREFAALSEQELDRIEALVQSLLKIAKLDAGTIVFEKELQNISEMMSDLERRFSCQAEQEGKHLVFLRRRCNDSALRSKLADRGDQQSDQKRVRPYEGGRHHPRGMEPLRFDGADRRTG